jgi:hypothetical protein
MYMTLREIRAAATSSDSSSTSRNGCCRDTVSGLKKLAWASGQLHDLPDLWGGAKNREDDNSNGAPAKKASERVISIRACGNRHSVGCPLEQIVQHSDCVGELSPFFEQTKFEHKTQCETKFIHMYTVFFSKKKTSMISTATRQTLNLTVHTSTLPDSVVPAAERCNVCSPFTRGYH